MHGTRVKKWLAVTWIGALTFGLYGFGDGTPMEFQPHDLDDRDAETALVSLAVQPTDVYVCDAEAAAGAATTAGSRGPCHGRTSPASLMRSTRSRSASPWARPPRTPASHLARARAQQFGVFLDGNLHTTVTKDDLYTRGASHSGAFDVLLGHPRPLPQTNSTSTSLRMTAATVGSRGTPSR